MIIDPFTFILIALAVFRISRLIIEDQIFEWLRERIWKKFPPHTWLGYLITCYWCLSIWFSLAFAICYTIVPVATAFVALPFALSAVAALVSKRLDD